MSQSELWQPDERGVVNLPSGRRVRGRALRHYGAESQLPDFGVVLSGRPPKVRFSWESRWLKWPDFWLPSDDSAVYAALREAWRRSLTERVDVACGGGVGRTGTALACIAVLDGLPPGEAIDFVRSEYHRRAAETPWQKRYVSKFDALRG